jgi:hypothetical protein
MTLAIGIVFLGYNSFLAASSISKKRYGILAINVFGIAASIATIALGVR